MGYTYKSKPQLPDDLSVMHSRISRGLELDIDLVQRTLPESRKDRAADLCDDVFMIETMSPSWGGMAGMMGGVVGFLSSQNVPDTQSRIVMSLVSLALIGASYFYKKNNLSSRTEGARLNALKKFFNLANRSGTVDPDQPVSPSPHRKEPFWREDRADAPDQDIS